MNVTFKEEQFPKFICTERSITYLQFIARLKNCNSSQTLICNFWGQMCFRILNLLDFIKGVTWMHYVKPPVGSISKH